MGAYAVVNVSFHRAVEPEREEPKMHECEITGQSRETYALG